MTATPNPGGALPKRAVVIDDDEVMLLSCREVLSRAGYEVETFDNGAAGIQRIAEEPPPILVVDLKMPGLDGLEVIRRVRAQSPEVVILVITGFATVSTAVEAMREGAYDFLPKPFTPGELRLITDRAFERWRLARESEQLRREKEAVERRFVTFVSHQLKSPLAAVSQYLDVLLYTSRAELPSQATAWIERSRARIAEMLAIIDDWLTLSRLDRALLSEQDASADLGSVLARVVEAHRTMAQTAGVSLVVAPGSAPSRVRGDETSVAMLVSNLVNNAIKYNRRGGSVVLRTRLRPDGVTELEVEDTGLGVPEEFLPHLFEEFRRARTPETEGVPGTGLGLAICKKIASELGGSVGVSTRPGAGTTFTVVLPAATQSGGAEAGDRNG